MKKLLSIISIVSLTFAMNCSLVKNVKKWGGHYYTITTERLTWQQAKEFAEANGGYLAIPNSSAENSFLQSLIPKPKYAWIGVYDPNYMTNYCYSDTNCAFDDSRFETIKGNPLTYKNWATDQPDNLVKPYDVYKGKTLVSPLGEHWVAMASTNGQWADFGNHADEYNNPVKFFALVEFNKMPDCYTPDSNVSDKWKGAKCNTQIYDTKTGNLERGRSYTCLQDKYKHYYCPEALAPCGQEWDYKDGYAVSHTGRVADYTRKVGQTTYTTPIPLGNKCSSYGVYCNGSYAFSWTESGKQIIADIIKKYGAPVKVYYNGSYKGELYSVNDITHYHDQCDGFGIGTKNWTAGCFSGKCNRGSQFSFCVAQTCDPVKVTTYGGVGCENHSCVGYYCRNTDYVGCPSGYHKVRLSNGHYGCAATTWTCPAGYHSNGSNCVRDITYSYYQYKCSGSNQYGEPYEPVNPGYSSYSKSDPNPNEENPELSQSPNSPTPPKNNCKAKNFVCKPAPNRKCVWVDRKWQCSPFPCFGEGVGDYNVINTDTPTGIDDANNNGWNANGTCSGTIYIFNGKDMRCRSSDAFFGLTGGGCCNTDKVFFGLVSCSEDEKMLAKKRKNNVCHYIGEYCSKKLKFIGCVQHKKTYCCFNSLLARIINEQGRPQLHKSWGSPEHPNCRGFTPAEFQKLDFSKMNLSEFYKQISQNISQNVLNNMTQYMKNSIQSQLQSIQNK